MRAFVIAMENEAAAVRPSMAAEDRLFVSGVGKVNAAAATQRAIDAGATEIWNAGVAGGFDPDFRMYDVCVVERAVEYDFDLAQLNGTGIGVHNERTTPYFELCADYAPSLKRVTLATGDHFRDADDDVPTFAALGATVRDMEGAAIAHVCEANGVPCRMVKCLCDIYGGGSMTRQYAENLKLALERLSSAMKEILASHG